MENAAVLGIEIVAATAERRFDDKSEVEGKVVIRDNQELIDKTTSIRHDSRAVLNQLGGSLHDSSVDLRVKKSFDNGLDVEATPLLVEGITLCEEREYPKAMRVLRKNKEIPGTVNWCRTVLYSSYATFFHCSKLYFLNKDLQKEETAKCCGGTTEKYSELAEEMRLLIRQSLKDCHEVAGTILDADESVKGDELDLICQMCFSIMSLGNAYGLQDDQFLDHALGLAGVWAYKRNTVLAHTEKSMLESKRMEDPLKRITETMEGLSKDIKKLGDNVKGQGSTAATISNVAVSVLTSAL